MHAGPTPAISVIIPTYRRPERLRQCLKAVAAQTFQDFEVIVVNDAGPPVAEVTAAFSDLQLTVIDQPVNQGHVAARNRGVAAARGDCIALCDDDDLWLPVHLEGLMAAAAAGADLAYSDAEVVTLRREPGGRVPEARAPFAFAYSPDLLRRWNTIPPSTALYRRSLHRRLGLFDETVADYWDWDWWLRVVADTGRVARVATASVLVAVDSAGENASASPERMAPNLARLTAKHGLGPLPASNFLRMTREPALDPWRRSTRVLWDGAMPPGLSPT